jgi:hypothetical protein
MGFLSRLISAITNVPVDKKTIEKLSLIFLDLMGVDIYNFRPVEYGVGCDGYKALYCQ